MTDVEPQVPSIPALQGQLGRSSFQLLVLVGLVVLLSMVTGLRRRGYPVLATTLAALGLTGSLAATLGLTLRPLVQGGPAVRTLHLDPIAGAWGWDSIAWGPVIDNVALFVPVGALAVAVWWRRSPAAVWFTAVALSVAIETTQFLLPIGRVANAADVLANGTGALIGVLLASALGVRSVRSVPSPGSGAALGTVAQPDRRTEHLAEHDGLPRGRG